MFAEKNISFLSGKLLGKDGKVLKCLVADEKGYQMEAIYFGDTTKMLADLRNQFGEKQVDLLLKGYNNQVKLTIAYYPDINEFRGKKTLQIVITNYCF